MENSTNNSLVINAGIVVYKYFFLRQIIAAIFFTASILGAVGNSFTILAVTLSKKLKTTTNVFVVNLAVADLLSCIFIPWQGVAVLGGDDWPIPNARWICVIGAFVIIITIGCSVNNLALIAINRWVGITKSRLTTRRIYTSRKLALMVIFSWSMPLCCALTPMLTDFGELGYERVYGSCTWDLSNPYSFQYSITITAVNYPIQLFLITLSYISIFRYVLKTSRNMARADAPSISADVSGGRGGGGGGGTISVRKKLWKRQLDVTKNLVYIVLAFLFCLTPYCVIIYLTDEWSYQLVPWGAVILFCNSCINPIIYATSHPDFKIAFRHMIRCQKIPLDARGSSRRYK